MGLSGLHTQPPWVAGVVGETLALFKKTKRTIDPLSPLTPMPKQFFPSGDPGYLVKRKNGQREENPAREPEPAMCRNLRPGETLGERLRAWSGNSSVRLFYEQNRPVVRTH